MKLLIQPGDGARPLIKAINRAKRSVEIAIFRFDQREIEKALAQAVSRGVAVQALIAHTNRLGEENLRKLELRLLGAGVTVARTADDLIRYHGKYMIVDRAELHLCAFNLTYLDIERSRSFGVISGNRELVSAAVRLFEADSKRNPYEADLENFVVSPVNARKQLAAFIRGTRKQLLIYDPKISDSEMLRALDERGQAGVNIRVLGKVTRKASGLEARKLLPWRLHTRTMVRDGRAVFMGSQSLRELELDKRREVGVIFTDAKIAARIAKVFEEDWAATASEKEKVDRDLFPADLLAKRVAKAVAKELPAVAPVVDSVVKELTGQDGELELNPEMVEETVKDAVKEAVKEAVRDVVETVAEQGGGGGK